MIKHDQAALDAATQIIDLFSSPGQWRETWHLKHKVQCLLIDLLERNATQPADGEPVAHKLVAVQANGEWQEVRGKWVDGAPITEMLEGVEEGYLRVELAFSAPPAAAPVAAGEPVAWMKFDGSRVLTSDVKEKAEQRTLEGKEECAFYNIPLYTAPPAAAHGDEAVRKDATEGLMQRACAELPEDWYIEVHLENGSGYATLFNDGIVVDFGQDFESMGAQVEAAIDAAMRAQAGEGGEV